MCALAGGTVDFGKLALYAIIGLEKLYRGKPSSLLAKQEEWTTNIGNASLKKTSIRKLKEKT